MIHRSSRGADKFDVGDKVWLDSKNLALVHESRKIAPLRHGPFVIKDVIGPITYRLVLPTTWKIHPVFTVDRLTRFQENDIHGPNYTKPPPDLIDGTDEYKVEAILKHRVKGRKKKLSLLVAWKGYPASENTWLSESDFVNAPDVLLDYKTRHSLQ